MSELEIKIEETTEQFGVEQLVSRQPNIDLFGIVPIKSISFKQDEIIESILHLHSVNNRIDVDATYSIGNFYKGGIQKPEYKFDINPQAEGVLQADARHLPLGYESVYTIMFDPPFLIKTGDGSIIKDRFSCFPDVKSLWQFYYDSLKEFNRVLKPKGIVIFKCQDAVLGSGQHFMHVEIMNYAVQIGFYPKDLFILLFKNRMYQEKDLTGQQHARKHHTYFWVFQKSKCKIPYGLSC